MTWNVEYGKVTKSITNPAGKSIASVKRKIEESKAFLEGLKEAKEKDRRRGKPVELMKNLCSSILVSFHSNPSVY
ncbi:MAG: hypothetical protein RRY06_08495 [Lachnospiraceae bacterium]